MKKASGKIKIIVWIIGILCVCLIFVLYFTQFYQKKFRIGTGNPGGTYYSYIKEFSELADSELNISRVETSGTVASIRLLQKGFIDGAIVQNDLLYNASKGIDFFEEENTKDNLAFSAVAGLYTESLQIVTHRDSTIETIEDLKGKRISVGEDQSGVILNAADILDIYGMSFNDVECRYLSYSDSAKALANGEIDAFICMAGAPTNAITGCAENSDLRILSLDDSDIEKLISIYPYYVSCTIPAGTYKGINEDIHTIGVRAVLVVSNSRSQEEVKILTDDIIKYSEKLNESIVTDGQLSPEEAATDIAIPFHSGAASYYNDFSITVPVDPNSNSKVLF